MKKMASSWNYCAAQNVSTDQKKKKKKKEEKKEKKNACKIFSSQSESLEVTFFFL